MENDYTKKKIDEELSIIKKKKKQNESPKSEPDREAV
jgi:hypothetical protein